MPSRSLLFLILSCVFITTATAHADVLNSETDDVKKVTALRVDFHSGLTSRPLFFHVTRLDPYLFLVPEHALMHLNARTIPTFLSQIGLRPTQARRLRVYYFYYSGGLLYGSRPLLDAVAIADSTFYNTPRMLEALRRVAYPVSYAQPQILNIEVPHFGDAKHLLRAEGVAFEPSNASLPEPRLSISQLNTGAGNSGAPIILNGTQGEDGSLLGLLRCRLREGYFLGTSINSLLESNIVERPFGNFIQSNQALAPNVQQCVPIDSKKGGGG